MRAILMRLVFPTVPVAFLLACSSGDTPSAPRRDSGLDSAPRPLDAGPDAQIVQTPPGLFCTPGTNPTNPILTDFSSTSYSAARGKWGVDGNLTGATYSYKDINSTASSKIEAESFTLTGQVVPGSPNEESYAGFGLHFDACVNTATYSGFQFTLSGTNGGCDVYFQVQTYSEQPTGARGGCASYCYDFPKLKVTPRPSPMTVLFSDVVNTGIPKEATAIAAEIVGLRWQIEPAAAPASGSTAACPFSLTIDDIKFVK